MLTDADVCHILTYVDTQRAFGCVAVVMQLCGALLLGDFMSRSSAHSKRAYVCS
eukprot:31256_4